MAPFLAASENFNERWTLAVEPNGCALLTARCACCSDSAEGRATMTGTVETKNSEVTDTSGPESTLFESSGDVLLPSVQKLVAAALGVGILLRLYFAFTDWGTNWPDEHYQSLEPAHSMAYGYGKLAWEQLYGARNVAFPAILAAIMRASTALGPDDPSFYLGVIRIALIAVGVGTAWGVYRLGRAIQLSANLSALAACVYVLSGPVIYFNHRAITENPSMFLAIVGLSYTVGSQSRLRDYRIGAAFLGAAVILRLQCGLFCLVPLVLLLRARKWRELAETSVVLAGMAMLYGLIDAVSWGEWFFSLRQYLNFNVNASGSEMFGVSPWYQYLVCLVTAGGPVCVLAVGLGAYGAKKSPLPFVLAAGYVLVHSCIAHKELRFILPAWPLLALAAAVGVERLVGRASCVASGALAVLAVYSATTFRQLSSADIGGAASQGVPFSALGSLGSVNRLILLAHDQQELCGLLLENVNLSVTAGYSHLHRKVPFESEKSQKTTPKNTYNFAITQRRPGPNQELVETHGDWKLLRLPGGTCENGKVTNTMGRRRSLPFLRVPIKRPYYIDEAELTGISE